VAREIANLKLERLAEVGKYFLRDEIVNLPVEPSHPWFEPWQRFERIHAALGDDILKLLITDPLSQKTLAPAGALASKYGVRLSTERYLRGLKWMPDGLREIIAIHTLNAGIAPERTLALYATIPAVMAREGVFVPQGGVYEIALALARLAVSAGAKIVTGVEVTSVSKGRVATSTTVYDCDYVVAATDANVADKLRGRASKKSKRVSCSGVALFVTLNQPLPQGTVTHSVIMPDEPKALHSALDNFRVPAQTMAFLNYYKPQHIYPNSKATAAILLTAPANGEKFAIDHPFVQSELKRISTKIGLDGNIADMIEDYKLLDPSYFEGFGARGGSLYGSTRPIWQGGPFHRPSYSSVLKPWFWRVGASVHPGGGVPAVLGGAMSSIARLLKRIG
jgi:phytoene desaturase